MKLALLTVGLVCLAVPAFIAFMYGLTLWVRAVHVAPVVTLGLTAVVGAILLGAAFMWKDF